MKSSVASLSEQVSTLKEDLAKQDVLDKVQVCCIVFNIVLYRYFNTWLSIIRNSVSIAIILLAVYTNFNLLMFQLQANISYLTKNMMKLREEVMHLQGKFSG